MNNKLPFKTQNLVLFAGGVFLLLLGYYLMSIGPHDGFLSLTLSPILLIISYVFVIPYSIMKKF